MRESSYERQGAPQLAQGALRAAEDPEVRLGARRQEREQQGSSQGPQEGPAEVALHKICKDCGQDLPLDRFYRAARGKYGRKAICKDCVRIKLATEWNPIPRERWNEYAATYRQKHATVLIERKRDYYQSNKQQAIDAAARRKAAINGVEINDFTTAQWLELLEEHGHACYYCGASETLYREHKTPISRGGNHTKSNIVPSCRLCNLRKFTMTEQEFRESDRWPA
jgi:5-methylcytosine-specific restriction endonuclease McrA